MLNKEDPIGILNQKPPYAVFVVSDDFGRQKGLGILKAAQRFRESGLRIIGLLAEPESAAAAHELCDAALVPPWRTADLRAILARFYEELIGKPLDVSGLSDRSDTSNESD